MWTDEFFTLFQATGHGSESWNLLDRLSKEDLPQGMQVEDLKKFLKNDPAKNLADVNNSLLETDTHPPFYFWVMHYWIKISGDSPFIVRLFSVLMGILASFLVYQVAKIIFDEKTAILSFLLMSTLSFAVKYSQEARSYSLIMVLGLLSFWFLLRFEKNGKNPDILGFFLATALGIYTHYFYLLIYLSQFIYFSIAHRNNTALLNKFYLAFLGVCLLFSPWVNAVLKHGYNFFLVEWAFGYPGTINKIGYLFSGLGRYFFMGSFPFQPGLVLLFSVIAVSIFNLKAKGLRHRGFLFCLAMFLVPWLGMFALDILQKGALLQQERFWVFSFLGLILIAGHLLNIIYSKNKLIVYLIIFVVLLSSIQATEVKFGPKPKEPSLWINHETHGKPAAVIVYNMRSVVMAQSYYLKDNIIVIPVKNKDQLSNTIKSLYNIGKVFIVRHYHATEPSLMNQPFMDTADIGEGFKLKKSLDTQYIKVREFAK